MQMKEGFIKCMSNRRGRMNHEPDECTGSLQNSQYNCLDPVLSSPKLTINPVRIKVLFPKIVPTTPQPTTQQLAAAF
jgi:hypothetical protein